MKTALYAVIALISLNFEFTLGKNDFFESSDSENDWDPSRDFFGDHTVQEKDSQPERKGTSKKFYNNEEDLLHKAYLARFINIFLRSSGFTDDVFEADSKTLKVDLTLSKEDFNILKRFVSDGDVSIEALENSFRSMFNKKHYFHIETSIVMEYLKYAILIALLLAIVFYIFFIIRKINFSIPGIRFILLFAYISIVLHELLKQYEDISENIVIRRIEFENAGKPPKECIYSKMTYLEKIYAHIFKDDVCQRFIQSRKSVWYEIDLVSVLVKPFQLMFSTLCSMLGEGNEKMIKPFIERSPWPLNIFLEFIVTVMQIPLLFFSLFLIWFTFTSRTISFNIPYICSMAAEKKEELNFNQASKKLQEEHKLHSSEGSKKTIVYNKGGIVLLGNEDKQYQSYSIQGSSSLKLNSQPQTFKISQQSYGSYMNGETDYSEDKNTSSLFNKQLALNKKEVRREHKKLTYFKKMNFKPNKRSAALKVAKENLDILPTYEH